jgi:hypothetical protein
LVYSIEHLDQPVDEASDSKQGEEEVPEPKNQEDLEKTLFFVFLSISDRMFI